MSQYQRMVSYLYEYKQGVKGVNVGYVRIEQRGTGCRISLQMRSRNLGQLSDVAVFRQRRGGIRYYTIGALTEKNGDYRCRIETESGNLMGSGIDLSDVEGIVIYQNNDYYIATTWKNQTVYLGENRIWDPGESEEPEESGTVELEPMDAKSAESEEIPEDEKMALEKSDMQAVEQKMNQRSLERDESGSYGQEVLGKNDIPHPLDVDAAENYERRDWNGEGPGNYGRRNWNGEGPGDYGRRDWNGDGRGDYGRQDWNGDGPGNYGRQDWNGDGPENYGRRDWNGDGPGNHRQSVLEGNDTGKSGQPILDRDVTEEQGDQQFSKENEEQKGMQSAMESGETGRGVYSAPGQNAMPAMRPLFPRWTGMPLFRRRPMGNGNIPIPQMAEWSNGDRHMAEPGVENHTENVGKEREMTQQGASSNGSSSRQNKEQIEEQAVCRNCPFKRKGIDYGKRILMTFPVMRPFPNDQQLACVRIEPQDLGCLPMQMWTLANNHFLLQGYYCYRHLIFMEAGKQGYALGVPGIYDRRTSRQAEQFGFVQFRAICGGKQCNGAFGYWIMPLSC